jgi:hypothetical protein
MSSNQPVVVEKKKRGKKAAAVAQTTSEVIEPNIVSVADNASEIKTDSVCKNDNEANVERTASTLFSSPEDDVDNSSSTTNHDNVEQKIPKKRGRKPKGGKIIKQTITADDVEPNKPNIILHLKCNLSDIEDNIFSLGVNYDPNVVENVNGYSFASKDLNYDFIKPTEENANNNVCEISTENKMNVCVSNNSNSNLLFSNDAHANDNDNENDNVKDIWKKLAELETSLHLNDISDKKSACFWCTCDFDNPPIYIPRYQLNNAYHVYGCFCSPECAAAFLMKENIDTASKFERYHLLNHIYCKLYNYEKNIKPAPNPFYTLNKYYGNLTIQEYRKLLKNERLLLVVDKPLTRQLPELHQDNDDFIINNNSIPSASKYKLRRKGTKQTKNDILSEKFGIK